MAGGFLLTLTLRNIKVTKMEQEIKTLKERVVFLEALLDMNSQSLKTAIETNEKLIEHFKTKIQK